jgi:tetratricopeptide (TPR) repeat protein
MFNLTMTHETGQPTPRRARPTQWAALFLFAAVAVAPALAQTNSPQLAEALHAGAEAMRSGDLATATAQFKTAVSLAPQMAEAHLNLGLALEQRSLYPEAVAELTAAAKLKPTLRGANLFLGIADYQLNRLDQAKHAFEREVRLSPSDAKAWMWLGVTQAGMGRRDEAVAALDKAYALDPKDPDILYHRGRAHLLVSKASYEAMFALAPDSYRVHEVLGQAAMESQQTAEAITEFKLAIDRAPHQAGLHEELGDLYWATGKTKEADEAYTAELALDPYSVTGVYKLGCLKETEGDAQGAKPLLEKAIAFDPTLENAYYYLGRAQLDLGDDADGVANLERASQAKGDIALNTLADYQLAQAYRRLHRNADATAALARFRALRAQADALEADKNAERVARHTLPRQEPIPADPNP